jgi:hypothetical protein
MQCSRDALGLLLIVFVLVLNLLAASPALHQSLHHDANHAEHQCAVTLFAHGNVDSVTVDVPAAVPLTFADSSPLVKFSIFSPAIENLPAGRAPPVSSSNS